MNIYGIGTDIVNIKRIEKLWDKYNIKFAKHILTVDELNELEYKKNKIAFISKRFAAKEAIVKSLGTGFIDDIYLTQVGIVNSDLGKPYVKFYGKTENFINNLFKNKKYNINISISDEKEYAVAFSIVTL